MRTPAKAADQQDHSALGDLRLFGPLPSRKPGVNGRDDQGGQECRGDQAADHDGGEWTLNLGSGGMRNRHRQETETGDEGGHQDGP